MSYQASNWAKKQTTGSPAAKAALMILAFYADERGECFPSLKLIAEETEQSVKSVQRRHTELEKLGLIFRAKQCRRAAGRYGAGTTILLMGGRAIAYARSLGYDETKPGGADDVDEEAEDSVIGQDDEDAGASLNDDDEGRPDCLSVVDPRSDCPSVRRTLVSNRIITREYPIPPKVPPPEKFESISDEPEWDEFEKLWPWSDGALREPARRAWFRLTAADKTVAIQRISYYVKLQRRRGRRAIEARRYLRDKGWEAKAASAKQSLVPVYKGTPAWDAWAPIWHRKFPHHRKLWCDPRVCEDGIVRDTRWAPSRFPKPGDFAAVGLDPPRREVHGTIAQSDSVSSDEPDPAGGDDAARS